MNTAQEEDDKDTPISNKEKGPNACSHNFMDNKPIAQDNDLRLEVNVGKEDIDNQTPLLFDSSPDKDLLEKRIRVSSFPSYQRQITGKLVKLFILWTKYYTPVMPSLE